jgi:serine/threonine-protein kinase
VPIDRRADVFAMGIVLYSLTTGKHPFRKESEGATLFAITAPEPVVAPRQLLPDYPEALQEVVLKALEKDRDRRYQTASELLRALDRALPPTARGSEEEVGAFVQGLFAAQRKKSQQALADALDRADKHQLSKSGTKFTDATLSGQSGLSGMSTVGLATSLGSSSADLESLPSRRSRLFKLAVVAGLGLAGLLGAVLFSLGSEEAKPAGSGKPSDSAAVATGTPPPAPPPLALSTLPVESAAPRKPSPPSSDSRKSGVPRPKPDASPAATEKPASPSTSPGAEKPSWKHDPGF